MTGKLFKMKFSSKCDVAGWSVKGEYLTKILDTGQAQLSMSGTLTAPFPLLNITQTWVFNNEVFQCSVKLSKWKCETGLV